MTTEALCQSFSSHRLFFNKFTDATDVQGTEITQWEWHNTCYPHKNNAHVWWEAASLSLVAPINIYCVSSPWLSAKVCTRLLRLAVPLFLPIYFPVNHFLSSSSAASPLIMSPVTRLLSRWGSASNWDLLRETLPPQSLVFGDKWEERQREECSDRHWQHKGKESAPFSDRKTFAHHFQRTEGLPDLFHTQNYTYRKRSLYSFCLVCS